MAWFGSSTPPPPGTGPGPHSSNPLNAPIGSKAVPRGTVLNPAPDPQTTLAANSDAMLAAADAAARQRKRGAGGQTLVTGAAGSGINPPPSMAPRTLVGY